jgi:hypothetical protein
MRIIALSCLLFSLAGFGIDWTNGIPSGNWAGNGHWEDSENNEGDYTAGTEFFGNDVRLSYQWEGTAVYFQLEFWWDGTGTFDVLYQGESVGRGSASEDRLEYAAEIHGSTVSETWVFVNDNELHKFGSKAVGDHSVRWQEVLYVIAAPIEENPIDDGWGGGDGWNGGTPWDGGEGWHGGEPWGGEDGVGGGWPNPVGGDQPWTPVEPTYPGDDIGGDVPDQHEGDPSQIPPYIKG